MPEHYQDRAAQVQAIGRARHWLERLAQLTQFERIVLHSPRQRHAADHAGDHRPPAQRRDRGQG